MVIGIIAILIGILLPALTKARRQAQATQCMSNLRQLATAVVSYTEDNDSWMPCRAGDTNTGWSNGIATTSDPTTINGVGAPDNTGMWIAWHYINDPYTGLTSQFGIPSGTSDNDQNLSYSSLAKYLGIPYTKSVYAASAGTPGVPLSNDVNAQFANVFRCPGDDVQSRPKTQANAANNQEDYYYSYSMNDFVGNPIENPSNYGSNVNARAWGVFTGKITSIKNSANIVLFVCEDNRTLDDGCFSININNWILNKPVNTLSTRHYVNKLTVITSLGQNVNQDGYGNASFCDGHAEVISRKDVFRQAHSGSPQPDPAGF